MKDASSKMKIWIERLVKTLTILLILEETNEEDSKGDCKWWLN